MLRNFCAPGGFVFWASSLSAWRLEERKYCAIEQNSSFAETVCGVVIIQAVVHLRRAAILRRAALSRGNLWGPSNVGKGNETEYTNVFGQCCIYRRSCFRSFFHRPAKTNAGCASQHFLRFEPGNRPPRDGGQLHRQ